MSNINVHLVQTLYAAFKRGDIGPIIGALAPDVAWHSHGSPEDYPTLGLHKGPQAVAKFFQTVAENQPRSTSRRANSTRPATEYSSSATMTGRCVRPARRCRPNGCMSSPSRTAR